MLDATRMAGLNCLRLMNDTTAGKLKAMNMRKYQNNAVEL